MDGYSDCIERPMDLDTIREKFAKLKAMKQEKMEYDLTAFNNDVLLMLDNCCYFNFRPLEGFYYLVC